MAIVMGCHLEKVISRDPMESEKGQSERILHRFLYMGVLRRLTLTASGLL